MNFFRLNEQLIRSTVLGVFKSFSFGDWRNHMHVASYGHYCENRKLNIEIEKSNNILNKCKHTSNFNTTVQAI